MMIARVWACCFLGGVWSLVSLGAQTVPENPAGEVLPALPLTPGDPAGETLAAVPVTSEDRADEVLPAAPVAPREKLAEAVIDAEVVPDEGEGEEANRKAKLVAPVKEPYVADIGKPRIGEEAVRLQIFLDQRLFGPGFIDGKPGSFTSKAVYAYNRSKGRSPGDWTAVIDEVEKELGETYATAIVPEIAKEYVNPDLPTKRSLQAKEKQMSYRSYLEFMAERYHTSEDFLVELNGQKTAWAAAPRKVLKVPNVDPFRIELLTEGKMHAESEVFQDRLVIIDTKGKQLFVYQADLAPVPPVGAVVVSEGEEQTPQKLVAALPITPGKAQFIHRGSWAILNSIELPSWRYDEQFLKTGKRSKETLQIPPGPNNPVGIIWNGLTKAGIGIHGTSSPRTIGRSQSAGCIRLSNWDAARFPDLVRPGVKVVLR